MTWFTQMIGINFHVIFTIIPCILKSFSFSKLKMIINFEHKWNKSNNSVNNYRAIFSQLIKTSSFCQRGGNILFIIKVYENYYLKTKCNAYWIGSYTLKIRQMNWIFIKNLITFHHHLSKRPVPPQAFDIIYGKELYMYVRT